MASPTTPDKPPVLQLDITGLPPARDDQMNRGAALKATAAELRSAVKTSRSLTSSTADPIAAYRRMIEQTPSDASAWNGLGLLLDRRNDFAGAAEGFQRAIDCGLAGANVRMRLGNALLKLGRVTESLDCFARAVEISPRDSNAWFNLGNLRSVNHDLDGALLCHDRAIAIRPDFAEAWLNRGHVLKSMARLDEAIACFEKAALLQRGYPLAWDSLLYTLHYHPGYDAAAIFAAHSAWNRSIAREVQVSAAPRQISGERLKIGYVSPDFREHPVGLNLLPLLRHHDQGAVEVFCYSDVQSPDSITDEFRSLAHHWRETAGIADTELAKQIESDRVDILVDLALHTAKNRLRVFAAKPAPIQVTFAGYPGTTGLTTIDYRLTDPYLDTPERDQSACSCNACVAVRNGKDKEATQGSQLPTVESHRYSERSIRLPDTFWCYEPRCGLPVGDPPQLKNGFVTFGCLNNFCKLNSAVLQLWARTMCAVPGSRLLLLASSGSHRQWVLRILGEHGIAADRIEFADFAPRQQYMLLYHRIDIGLDTFPYNGHTTSLDSFWMGVPVVTMVGQTVVGRAGYSLLMNLGLGELAAGKSSRCGRPEGALFDEQINVPLRNDRYADEFVRIAGDLAADPGRLTDLRARLRERMRSSPLKDGARFARNIEAAYRQMAAAYCTSNSNVIVAA